MEIIGQKPTKYIASWSGGKDSTYMVDELLRRGEPLDEVIFCDTGYEFDIMYDYIVKVKEYWESKYPNITVTLLNWGKGKEIWKKYAEGKFTRGQHEGKPRGFPFHLGMSWCTRDLKVNPLKKHINKKYKGHEIKEYVGIAADEPNRIRDTNEVYPLVEWGVTERQAAEALVERGLHNPLYEHFHRTGCYTCPKQSLGSMYKLWKFYPKEWQEIKDMYNRYNEIGAAINKIKGFTIEELEEKFRKYDEKGNKELYYLEGEQEIGCMCK